MPAAAAADSNKFRLGQIGDTLGKQRTQLGRAREPTESERGAACLGGRASDK